MTDTATITRPDERRLLDDLSCPEMRAGVARGSWVIQRVSWPHLHVAVAASARPNGPSAFSFRIDATGYPTSPPAVALWDDESDGPLAAARRPKGDRAGAVWRPDWEQGLGSYAAFDRTGLKSHPEWATDRPLLAWHADRTLAWLLERISELLNRDDYLGT